MVSGSPAGRWSCQMFLSVNPDSAGKLTEDVSGWGGVLPESSEKLRKGPQRKLCVAHHRRCRPCRLSYAMAYTGEPMEYGPPTFHFLRARSAVKTKAPFIVPTRTRTSPFLGETCWTAGMEQPPQREKNDASYCRRSAARKGKRGRVGYQQPYNKVESAASPK